MTDQRYDTENDMRTRRDLDDRRGGGPWKWIIGLVVIVALAIGLFFLLGGDIDTDTEGEFDIEVPETDVDVDGPDVDIEPPDVDVDPGDIDVDEGEADADAG